MVDCFFLKKIFITFNRLFLPLSGRKILLAISGGSDSRAMLEILAMWKYRNKFKFFVVCFNHRTQINSLEYVKKLENRSFVLGFNVIKNNFVLIHAEKSEMILRNLRYAFLYKKVKKLNILGICTAHHSNDNMEGYIMNFFGFGGGKSGALVKKISSTREILIIRPLIDFSKNDILKILSYLKIDDYTVDDLDIRLKNNRSLIRNKILKYLKKYNMNLLKRSSDLSVMQANLNDYSYSLNFFNFIEFKKIKCLNFYLKIPILKEIFRLGIKNSLFFLNPLVDHRLSNKKINKMINRVTLNRRKEANRSDSLNDFIFFSKGYNAKFDFSGILVNISNCILNMKIS